MGTRTTIDVANALEEDLRHCIENRVGFNLCDFLFLLYRLYYIQYKGGANHVDHTPAGSHGTEAQ
jgi:hypothetical protein